MTTPSSSDSAAPRTPTRAPCEDADYETRLRTGATRIDLHITAVSLKVEILRPGPENGARGLSALLPEFEGYTFVEGCTEPNGDLVGIYLRTTNATSCHPFEVHQLRGTLLGRKVIFRLLVRQPQGPTLESRVVRCRVIDRRWSSSYHRDRLAGVLDPLLAQRIRAFMMGRLGRGTSPIATLPPDLVGVIAGHARLVFQ